MSLFANLQRNAAVVAGRRFASTASAIPRPPVPEIYQYNFRQTWLSDISTYPLITVMTGTMCFLTGMGLNALSSNAVKLSPKLKHEVISQAPWEEKDSVTKKLTRKPFAFHREAFKSLEKEGLGIDHEKWLKRKEEYSKN